MHAYRIIFPIQEYSTAPIVKFKCWIAWTWTGIERFIFGHWENQSLILVALFLQTRRIDISFPIRTAYKAWYACKARKSIARNYEKGNDNDNTDKFEDVNRSKHRLSNFQ